jgi:hypothetical protein
MQSKREKISFNQRDWIFVTVQSPLGAVMLARKVPPATSRAARTSAAEGLNRRSAPRILSDPSGKKARSRRSI